jgi:hypothetical protein
MYVALFICARVLLLLLVGDSGDVWMSGDVRRQRVLAAAAAAFFVRSLSLSLSLIIIIIIIGSVIFAPPKANLSSFFLSLLDPHTS